MTPHTSSAPAWQIADSLWIADDGDRIQLREGDKLQLVLQGAPARAVRDGSLQHPLLRAMAQVDAQLAEALRTLAAHQRRPLTRADVLRGSGFNLLFVELTNRCNERCSHCYADAGPERTLSLTWPTIQNVIDAAAQLGFPIVQLTGGDPLIHPDVVRAVAHARARGIETVELYTNGLALTRELLGQLEPHRPAFAFSVYSHMPEVHDEITRVPGSHNRTLRAIRSCLELGLRVRVGATLFQPNSAHQTAITDSLMELGLPSAQIAFNTSHAVGRGDYFEGDARSGKHHGVGTIGGGKACVSASGDVYPCIFARDVTLGSVHKESLVDILTDTRAAAPTWEIDEAARSASQRLSCSDCQLREALLAEPAARRPQLVQLRRSP